MHRTRSGIHLIELQVNSISGTGFETDEFRKFGIDDRK